MQSPLDRILAFNQQLILLSCAGIPIDLGDRGKVDSLESTIEKINSALSLAVARGQSAEAAVQQNEAIPDRYARAIATLFRCPDSTVALDALTSQAREQRELTFDLSHWLFQLGVLLLLALLGFTFLIFRSAPRLEAFFDDMGIGRPISLEILTFARNTYWMWLSTLIGLFVVNVVCWKMYSKRISWSVLPGGRRYATAQSKSEVANRLVSLTKQNMSLEDALAISGNNPATLPPLLHWAVEGDLAGESRDRVLQSIATTYQENAEDLGSLWRTTVPPVVIAVLGGIIVLAFALSLFLPWVYFLTVMT